MRTRLLGAALVLVLAACGGGDEEATPGTLDGTAADGGTDTTAPATEATTDGTEPSPTATDASTDASTASPDVEEAAPTTTGDDGGGAAPPASTTAEPQLPTGPLPIPSVTLEEVAVADRGVEVTARPGDDRLFVVEQAGRVLAGGATVADLTDVVGSDGNEQGLLGLAFHPRDPVAFVHYTDLSGNTVLAEYAIDPATAVFDPASARVLLTVDQPYGNHNGGELVVGPDGLLYLGLGDGGSADDPLRASLDLSSPLGKIHRLDPTPAADAPFTVPPDNPFVDGPVPTIWSSGLRNPWKFSFDPATGDLWIADVGQNRIEEVNRSLATDGAGRGANYGWSAFEGNDRFNDDQPEDGATPPLLTYAHEDGNCSVSGGAVARGEDQGALDGWYVYGDYCSGTVWGYDTTSPAGAPVVVELANVELLAAIAEGPDGLYAVSQAGPVLRLTAA